MKYLRTTICIAVCLSLTLSLCQDLSLSLSLCHYLIFSLCLSFSHCVSGIHFSHSASLSAKFILTPTHFVLLSFTVPLSHIVSLSLSTTRSLSLSVFFSTVSHFCTIYTPRVMHVYPHLVFSQRSTSTPSHTHTDAHAHKITKKEKKTGCCSLMQDKQPSHYHGELVLQVNNKVEMDEEDTKEKKVLENIVSQNNHDSYNL